MSGLPDRVARLRASIDAAVARRGPGPEVSLIAVSKRHPADRVREAAAAGLLDFGENYAQELRDKRQVLTEQPDLRWHFIGGLQRNKVKYVIGCALIHTVDRIELIEAIDARAARDGLVQPVLIQVDVGHEAQKSGIDPDQLDSLVAAFENHPAMRCEGLMAIPPAGTAEETRPYFRRLRELRDRIQGSPRPANVDLRHLSMGMSADFEVAIEEGATLVRVGTAIFGPRPS